MTESGLDGIRQRKMAELQQRMDDQAAAEQEHRALEMQKQAVLRRVLTADAKARLTNLKLANPDLAAKIEELLIYLSSTGKVAQVDDTQLKAILYKLQGRKREIKIVRK